MAENKEQDNNTVIPGTETEVNAVSGNNSGKVVNNSDGLMPGTRENTVITANGKEVNANSYNNLKPFGSYDSEKTVRELNAKGGRNSGPTKRKQRDMRKLAQIMLNNTMSDKAIKNSIGEHTELLQDEEGNEDRSAMALMMARMILEAQDGNTKASEFVRDTAGFKPEKNINLDAGISEADKELLEKVAKRLENKG